MPRQNRFTIYDMMEAKGVFEQNPANAGSRDGQGRGIYKGPVRYPRMLYHPEGKQRIASQGDVQVSPLYGPQLMNQQLELVNVIVEGPDEEARLLAEGWHKHPAEAIRARLKLEGKDPGEAPPMSSQERQRDLEDEIARLTVELAAAKASGGSKAIPASPAEDDD